jgi:hypothetical protein
VHAKSETHAAARYIDRMRASISEHRIAIVEEVRKDGVERHSPTEATA